MNMLPFFRRVKISKTQSTVKGNYDLRHNPIYRKRSSLQNKREQIFLKKKFCKIFRTSFLAYNLKNKIFYLYKLRMSDKLKRQRPEACRKYLITHESKSITMHNMTSLFKEMYCRCVGFENRKRAKLKSVQGVGELSSKLFKLHRNSNIFSR